MNALLLKNINDMKGLKNILAEAFWIVLFAVIALVYFYPADFDGRRLTRHDNGAADGLGVEINQYRDSHDGETPRWTNSVFGGMPTYQIAPSYDSTKKMSFIEKAYHLWLPDYVFYIFISMLGFYILLRAFDFRRWMAALGAIVWAFSSYFFIIIAAGHIWKVLTLAYIPPTIAGIVLCYRRRYLLGCAVTALFASLQITSNHVQMSYYFLIPEILIVIAFLIDSLMPKKEQVVEEPVREPSWWELFISRFKKQHRKTPADKPLDFKAWLKGSAAVLIAAVLAIGLNASNLYHTYEYAKDTMRGKSELVKAQKVDDQTDSGLERSYITAWSYGVGETWTFLIPDLMGGASVPLSENPTAMKKADPTFANAGIYKGMPQYWGEQPGTSGPVYLGALVCMLFVLALIVIPNKSPMKWALIIATILSVLLSWGKNFMGFTDFFIDYIPMYSKFRTVSSILVVAEFTVPLLAMLGLKRFVELSAEKETRGKMVRALFISTIITVVICAAFALGHSTILGDCISSSDRSSIDEYVKMGYFDQGTGQRILASMATMRAAMLSADAWRSGFIILLGGFFLFRIGRGKRSTLFIPNYVWIIAICLVDMWMVNKRYLNDQMFETPRTAEAVQKTDVDNYILGKSGEGRNYRVLNYAVSTFNDNTTSFFYSSVGGYHAAKLRRYQEVIEEHIVQEMPKVYDVIQSSPLDTTAVSGGLGYPVYDFANSTVNVDSLLPVINMLNTRWFILKGQNDVRIPIENNTAFGNAWFVDEVQLANNANEELAALHTVNPRHVAVVDKQFTDIVKAPTAPSDSTCSIKQTRLTCDEVDYEVDSKNGGLVVFSEIYYPGWSATIDGKEASIGRADYILRCMNVPAGKHTIHMEFRPQTVEQTETIANISFYVLIVILIIALLFGRKKSE
ncbi:MAG: YfhO family protein [Bacteroidaceae bacterium]|nr:YfhO family protein [Bacteroidaceae bacterium]